MSEAEKWKMIPGCEHYEISTLGRVRSLPHGTTSGKILKDSPHTRGYRNVSLTIDGKRKTQAVHRLMARTFLETKPGLQINHIDGDKANNRLENLEMVSARENQLHCVHILGRKKLGPLAPHMKEITERRARGESFASIGRSFGKTGSTVSDCFRRYGPAREALRKWKGRAE